MFILFVFITAYALVPVFTRHFSVSQYEYSNWDVRIFNSSLEQFNQKLDNENLNSMVAFSTSTEASLAFNGRSDLKNGIHGILNIKRLLDDSFEELYNLIIPNELMIDYDKNLFANANSIFINHRIAIELGANVGDVLQFNQVYSYDSEENKYILSDSQEYVVAAVFSPAINSHAIILNKSLPSYGELFFSELYVKFDKLEKALPSLNGYIEDGIFSRVYGSDWRNKISEDECSRLKKDMYEFRETLLSYYDSSSVYSKSTVFSVMIVSVFSTSLLFLNEKRKTLKLNRKSFGVFSAFGMSKKVFILYSLFNTLLTQTLLFILTLFTLKNFIYKTAERYLTNFIILEIIPLFVISFFITATVVCVLSVWTIRKEKLLEALNESE